MTLSTKDVLPIPVNMEEQESLLGNIADFGFDTEVIFDIKSTASVLAIVAVVIVLSIYSYFYFKKL